jgi:hypothetical protein
VHGPNTATPPTSNEARRRWPSVMLAAIGWLGSVFVAFSVPGTFVFVVVGVVLPGYMALVAFGTLRAARWGTLAPLLAVLAFGASALLLVMTKVPEGLIFRVARASMERDARSALARNGPMPSKVGPFPIRRAIRLHDGLLFEISGTRAGGADGYAWGTMFSDDAIFEFRQISRDWWVWHENNYGDSHTFDTVATGFPG